MIKVHRITLVTLALALVWTSARAQNEKNNWIFGHHTGTTFGQVPYLSTPPPGIDSYETCSSISDAAGNLSFYTDGILVWNKNHVVMPTVNATHLQGDINASALIVPKPQSGCNEYYIFTTDDPFNSAIQHRTLRYSVVNMNAAGGLGDVTVENVALQQDVSQQITAVADGLGGYWVMAHSDGRNGTHNDRFYSFHVTANGISPPTLSTGYPHITGYDPVANAPYPANWAAKGQMKFSQDGTRIASAVPSKYVEVCNFNKITGQVTGCIVFNSDLGGQHAPFDSSLVFGIEFSPQGGYLYVSTYADPNVPASCQLVQFDLQHPLNAGVVVAPSDKPGLNDMGDLQLAPDGQIYLARQGRYLSVVPHPDLAAPGCGFMQMALPISGVAWGLPNMVQGPFSCGTGSPCPPNATPTTINGITFCCTTDDNGKTCCKRLCPVGSAEAVVNGATLCCTAKGGSINSSTKKVCCSKPQ